MMIVSLFFKVKRRIHFSPKSSHMKDAFNLADLCKGTSAAAPQWENSGERICKVSRVPPMPDIPDV